MTTVLTCPHPPLLIRPLSGTQDVAEELRAACLAALRPVVSAGPAAVVVIGGADQPGPWDVATPVDVRRFGTTGPRTGPGLPLSLGVGRWLLDEAGWTGPTELLALSWDTSDDDLEALAAGLLTHDDVAVLLMGEGSTRRGETAPGFLDERAFPFDDVVADALDSGEGSELRTLDEALARELMVGGRAVFRLLGNLVAPTGRPADAVLDYRDDPLGVSYFVATWKL